MPSPPSEHDPRPPAPGASATDKFARALGVLSLLVGFGSLVLSWQGRRAAEVDRVSLTCEREIREIGKPVMLSHLAGRRIVSIPVQCDVTNTGERRLAIVDYQVQIVDSAGTEAGFYSGLRGNVIDGEFRRVGLPFDLQPGETRRVSFVVGLIADPAATVVLARFRRDTIYSGRALAIALAQRGLSLSGYPVSLGLYKGDTGSISLAWDTNGPRANPVRVKIGVSTATRAGAAVILPASSAWQIGSLAPAT